MRNIFRTPTTALLADVTCWTALIALLVYAYANVNSLVLSGVILAVTVAVGAFALWYNGRNIRYVVRTRLATRRYLKEEAKREEARRLEREEQDRRDAEYGRELRELNRRYDRY